MPKQEGVWGSLSALDAFPKVNEDFFKKTMSGGEQLAASRQDSTQRRRRPRRGL